LAVDPGWQFLPASIRQRRRSYVWETVTVHLPPLLAAAVAEIKALEGET